MAYHVQRQVGIKRLDNLNCGGGQRCINACKALMDLAFEFKVRKLRLIDLLRSNCLQPLVRALGAPKNQNVSPLIGQDKAPINWGCPSQRDRLTGEGSYNRLHLVKTVLERIKKVGRACSESSI